MFGNRHRVEANLLGRKSQLFRSDDGVWTRDRGMDLQIYKQLEIWWKEPWDHVLEQHEQNREANHDDHYPLH